MYTTHLSPMKKFALILCLLLSYTLVNAQESYTIKGEILDLKTDIEGDLDLLWGIIDGKYRYFVRTKEGTITELVNTKNEANKYQKEYITLLTSLTNTSAEKVNLTLFNLRNFIDDYNVLSDTDYTSSVKRAKMELRLGLFGGATNSPFVGNPNNVIAPQFGAEFEFIETNNLSRHAIFLQAKHVLEADDFDYSTTEIALGYRFRFIKAETFNIYANMKFTALNITNVTTNYFDEDNITIISEDVSETSFDVPLSFGIGADIKVTSQSYITIGYNELFGIILDNEGNFPTNITLGYKFVL